MKEFKLEYADHIALCDLLKILDLVESGAAAKHFISEGKVKVDGSIELRKRCKIRSGQTVEFNDQIVKII